MDTRETKTQRKHLDIFKAYEKKLLGYGDLAPKIKRTDIYEEIAEQFYCSTAYVVKVIRKMLKRAQ